MVTTTPWEWLEKEEKGQLAAQREVILAAGEQQGITGQVEGLPGKVHPVPESWADEEHHNNKQLDQDAGAKRHLDCKQGRVISSLVNPWGLRSLGRRCHLYVGTRPWTLHPGQSMSGSMEGQLPSRPSGTPVLWGLNITLGRVVVHTRGVWINPASSKDKPTHGAVSAAPGG